MSHELTKDRLLTAMSIVTSCEEIDSKKSEIAALGYINSLMSDEELARRLHCRDEDELFVVLVSSLTAFTVTFMDSLHEDQETADKAFMDMWLATMASVDSPSLLNSFTIVWSGMQVRRGDTDIARPRRPEDPKAATETIAACASLALVFGKLLASRSGATLNDLLRWVSLELSR